MREGGREGGRGGREGKRGREGGMEGRGVLGRRKMSNVSAWLSRRIQAKVGIALAMKTA